MRFDVSNQTRAGDVTKCQRSGALSVKHCSAPEQIRKEREEFVWFYPRRIADPDNPVRQTARGAHPDGVSVQSRNGLQPSGKQFLSGRTVNQSQLQFSAQNI